MGRKGAHTIVPADNEIRHAVLGEVVRQDAVDAPGAVGVLLCPPLAQALLADPERSNVPIVAPAKLS